MSLDAHQNKYKAPCLVLRSWLLQRIEKITSGNIDFTKVRKWGFPFISFCNLGAISKLFILFKSTIFAGEPDVAEGLQLFGCNALKRV